MFPRVTCFPHTHITRDACFPWIAVSDMCFPLTLFEISPHIHIPIYSSYIYVYASKSWGADYSNFITLLAFIFCLTTRWWWYNATLYIIIIRLHGILVPGPHLHQFLDWLLLVLRMRSSIFVGQEVLIEAEQVVIGFIKLVNIKAMLYAYKASETLWFE